MANKMLGNGSGGFAPVRVFTVQHNTDGTQTVLGSELRPPDPVFGYSVFATLSVTTIVWDGEITEGTTTPSDHLGYANDEMDPSIVNIPIGDQHDIAAWGDLNNFLTTHKNCGSVLEQNLRTKGINLSEIKIRDIRDHEGDLTKKLSELGEKGMDIGTTLKMMLDDQDTYGYTVPDSANVYLNYSYTNETAEERGNTVLHEVLAHVLNSSSHIDAADALGIVYDRPPRPESAVQNGKYPHERDRERDQQQVDRNYNRALEIIAGGAIGAWINNDCKN